LKSRGYQHLNVGEGRQASSGHRADTEVNRLLERRLSLMHERQLMADFCLLRGPLLPQTGPAEQERSKKKPPGDGRQSTNLNSIRRSKEHAVNGLTTGSMRANICLTLSLFQAVQHLIKDV